MKISLKSNVIQFALCMVMTSVLWSASSSAQINNRDVVLLMDSSGSMKRHDPENRRLFAAKLFVSKLAKTDRVAVVSFSDSGYPVAYLTKLSGKANQRKLFAAIDKISTRGVYSDYSKALEVAVKVLQRNKQKNRSRMIVLMSDGIIDIEKKLSPDQLADNFIQQTMPKLDNLAITLNTLTFSSQSNQRLMQRIAKVFGGTYNLAITKKSLSRVYTDIFEQNTVAVKVPTPSDSMINDSTEIENTLSHTADVMQPISVTEQTVTPTVELNTQLDTQPASDLSIADTSKNITDTSPTTESVSTVFKENNSVLENAPQKQASENITLALIAFVAGNVALIILAIAGYLIYQRRIPKTEFNNLSKIGSRDKATISIDDENYQNSKTVIPRAA